MCGIQTTLTTPRGPPVVEVEEALGGVHAQAGGHVLVVGQRGAEADQTHVLLGQLHVADGAGHQGLQHRASVVVQQVDLVLKESVRGSRVEGRSGVVQCR